MSDSEDASSAPSDAKIESTLKQVLARIFKADRENLSLARVRAGTEEELDLSSGWLKNNDVWKKRSKELTESEFSRLDEENPADSEDDEPVAKKPAKKSNGATSAKANPRKRKATEDVPKAAKTKPKARKKQRVSSDEENEATESDAMSSARTDETPSPNAKKKSSATRPAPASRRSKSATVVDSEDEDEEMPDAPASRAASKEAKAVSDDEEDAEDTKPAPVAASTRDGNESESSMSSLLDEAPTKKKRQKKSPAPKPSKPKTGAKARPAAKKETKELSADDEEIKRLQGWLVKCGIRKVWGKELKPFETSKAKIAHLKSMLADAGMTGRYSVEKARQIKEQRELAADLEAVTDFDKKWGQKEERGRSGRGDVARDLGLDPSLLAGSDDDSE